MSKPESVYNRVTPLVLVMYKPDQSARLHVPVGCGMIWLKILLLLTVTLLETTSQFGEECECGVRKSGGVSPCSRSGRVAGGDEADVGEFPWMALLVIRSTGKNTKRCGGTLINSRFLSQI